jgi:hypothetical protein
MLHLTDQPMLTDPALCGHQPDPADPDCVPLRWWNGNRDGVCPECLRRQEAESAEKVLTPPRPSAILPTAAG